MGETEIYAITNLIVDRGPQIKVKCLNDISHHSHPFSLQRENGMIPLLFLFINHIIT